MQRTIGRLSLGIVAGVAVFAFAAAPAFATTATTQPASQKTTTTAVLNGLIDTGGQATAWEFQWGKTTSYGRVTPLQQITAGNGTLTVSDAIDDLTPNTTYHFRLVATTGVGGTYYPLGISFGRDLTFTTNTTGKLLLVRSRLVVTNNFLSVPLRCSSSLMCHGRFTISTLGRIEGTNTFANVLCATTFFTVRAHKTGTVRVRARNGCLELLRISPNHSRAAKLTSNPRTGQKALIARVTLTLG